MFLNCHLLTLQNMAAPHRQQPWHMLRREKSVARWCVVTRGSSLMTCREGVWGCYCVHILEIDISWDESKSSKLWKAEETSLFGGVHIYKKPLQNIKHARMSLWPRSPYVQLWLQEKQHDQNTAKTTELTIYNMSKNQMFEWMVYLDLKTQDRWFLLRASSGHPWRFEDIVPATLKSVW